MDLCKLGVNENEKTIGGGSYAAADEPVNNV